MRTGLLIATALAGAAFAAVPPALGQTDDSTVVVAQGAGSDATGEPQPGQVIVRLNGRFRFYAGLFDDQDLNRSYDSTNITYTSSTVDIGGKTLDVLTANASTVHNQNKQADYGAISYLRLYPGFDGLTPGGIKFGASAEIRQDNTVAPGGGVTGTVSAANPYRGQLYVRRAWGYLGTSDLGVLRFGTIDDVSSLYLTGVLENFNDGGWNGDVRYGLATNAQLRWPFPDDDSAYVTTKLVYLSPAFGGFDFGMSWEPSSAGTSINDGNCSAADTSNTIGTSPFTVPAPITSVVGCDRLESTTVAAESGRRRDTVDVLLRYRHAFDNGLGVAATVSYTGGGHVHYIGPYYVSTGNDTVRPVTYNGLSIGDVGVQATYAGFLIGGNYQFGRFSNALASGISQSYSLAPVGAKPADAWSAGAEYNIGPVIMGASWVSTDSAGAFAYSAAKTPGLSLETPGLGQRHEEGLNAGGTLKVAPGLGVFLTYLWDERRQDGYDFQNSAIVAGTPDSSVANKIRAQALTLGTSLTW